MLVPRTRAPQSSPQSTRRRVAILGSTGSIGTSALEVVRRYPELFEVTLLAAGGNGERLAQQALEFHPQKVYLEQKDRRTPLVEALGAGDCLILEHAEDLYRCLNSADVDVVLASVVGFEGLASVVAALKGGCTVALANKESLVSAGALITTLIADHGGSLIPVDSEHSALFQALQGERPEDISELILTASGGPFFGYKRDQLSAITPQQALKHPTWSMGAKISIDSASMVNKALELAEAHWLFSVPADSISIVVHPKSIVHSLVNFHDGSTLAQLGIPDMKVAIAYALNYPQGRLRNIAPGLNLAEVGKLDFFPLDDDTFSAPSLMRKCLNQGGVAPAVFTIANDIAVERFLRGDLGFDRIIAFIESALARFGSGSFKSLSDLLTLRDRIYAERDNLR